MNNAEWYIKKDRGFEVKNYSIIQNFVIPMKAVPDFEIEENCLRIRKGKSYDMFFEFAEEQFKKLYCRCLQYFYSVQKMYYSQGYYAYISNQKDVISQKQINADQIQYVLYQKMLFEGTLDESKFMGVCVRDLVEYLKKKFKEYAKWQPQRFCLLQGDLFLSNIVVIEQDPKLIDLEYIRFGPREVELAHYFMHLLILRHYFKGNSEEYFHRIFNMQLDGIDFNSIRELFIPLTMYYRTMFASMGLIEGSQKIVRDFPILWEYYYEEFL